MPVQVMNIDAFGKSKLRCGKQGQLTLARRTVAVLRVFVSSILPQDY